MTPPSLEITFVPPFEDVEKLSRAYQQDANPASPPSMVAYLGQIKDGLKPTLLRNLLQIDIERRRQKGENPRAEDYLQWFPGHEQIIRREFLESVSVHRSTYSSLAADTAEFLPQSSRKPAASRLGDYHLLAELGRGGMGFVLEAVHTQRKDHVALKVLPDVQAEGLHRFKREFRSLADINHPNLIGLHALECDGDQWFFSMDLIDGIDFISYVRPAGKLDEARLRTALAQLVTGTMALHANHVIHCDLKPSNVLVDRDGRVVLLDFGLVLELEQSSEMETAAGISGTPAYMSPEQAAGQTATAASDWYAVGVMLYEALTGRLPFSGRPLEILHKKQNAAPDPLPDDAGLPADLCSLCQALLQQRVEDRPDALAIVQAVAASVPESTWGSLPLGDHRLVGRDVQLRQLRDALKTFEETRRPLAVFVDGRSGEGKTSLCEKFLEPLRSDSNFAVMSGRCYDRESVPYKALDSTIDAICGFLNGLTTEEVAALLPQDVSMLAHVFPVFGRVKGFPATSRIQIDSIDQQEVRTRAFKALRQLLGSIGKQRPIILFIDDLQWGDADSAKILLQVLESPQAPRVFLLGSYRTDEADASRFLQNWDFVQTQQMIDIERRDVSVGPLSQAECTELVVELLHQDNDVVRRRSRKFFEQTRGNSFLLIELVGCFDPQTDSFRPLPVHDVIDEKLTRLPLEAQRLLDVIAVSGQALQMEEASSVAGHEAIPTSTLIRMRSERLIRFLGSEEGRRIDTYHDRIRETVLAEMDDAVKRAIHREFAENIEQTARGLSKEQLQEFAEGRLDNQQTLISDRLFDLSFHFDKAGLKRQACAYSLLAAEQARQQFALEVAATQYEIAKRNSDETAVEIQRRIHFGIGDTYRLLGRYAEGKESLDTALHLAKRDLDRWETECVLSEVIRSESKYGDSAERLSKTLREMGVWVPQSRAGLAAALFNAILIQAWHTLARYPRQSSADPNEHERLIDKLLQVLIASTWFRNTPMTFFANLAAVNRAERFRPSPELGMTYALHGVMCVCIGLKSRGFKYWDRASSLIPADDLTIQLLTTFLKGLGLYAASQFEDCQQAHGKGLVLVERTGDQWRAAIMGLHIALSNYRMGQLGVALEQTFDAFEASMRLNDFNTGYDFINVVAMLTRGRFDYERMNANLRPIPDNYQATNQGLQAEAWWHLHCGRTQEAVDVAQQAFDLAKRHLVVTHITTPNFPLLLEAIRTHAATLRSSDPAEAERLLKRGYRLAKWGARITDKFPDYAGTLRELAHYQSLRGKIKKALKTLRRSLRGAESKGMQYEYAQSDLAYVQFRHELGEVTSDELTQAHVSLSQFTQQVEEFRSRHPLMGS